MKIEYPTNKWCHDTIKNLLNSLLQKEGKTLSLERGNVCFYTAEQLNGLTNLLWILKIDCYNSLGSVLQEKFQDLYFAEVRRANNISESELMDDETFDNIYTQYLDYELPEQELEKITLDFLLSNVVKG